MTPLRKWPWAGGVLLTIMFLAMIGPILTVMIWAFAEQWRYPNLWPTQWGFKFWRIVLARETVMSPIMTSLAISFVSTNLAALMCWPAAFAFARINFPGRQFLLFSFLAANAVPKFALYLTIAIVFLKLNLIGTFWGVVIAQMLAGLLYLIWIPTAALRAIPPALEEAGFDLGASRLRVFLEITLPQALPALVASYILAFVNILFEVDSALLIGAPHITTMPMLLLQLSTQVIVQEAAIVCAMIWGPCLVLLLLSRRLMSSQNIAQGLGA